MSFHWQHHIASLILDLSSRSDSSYKKKLSQDHVLLIIALSPVHGLSSVICTHYVNFVSDNSYMFCHMKDTPLRHVLLHNSSNLTSCFKVFFWSFFFIIPEGVFLSVDLFPSLPIPSIFESLSSCLICISSPSTLIVPHLMLFQV